MTTDKCPYCEREQGLRVFLNRYILSKNLDDKSEISNLNNLEQERSVIREIMYGFESDEISSELKKPTNLPNNIIKMETISTTVSGKSKNFYKNIYGDKNVKGYGFKGSVLRKGYLYVYMEHMGISGWQEYEVSDSGFLKRINNLNFFKVDSEFKSEIKQQNEPCSLISHRAESLTIVVPKALDASNVYFKYSESQWSKKTREKNSKNYKKNMNVFNVPDFLNGMEKQGVFPISSGITSFCVDKLSEINKDEVDEKVSYLNINTVAGNVSKNIQDIKSALSYLAGKDLEYILNEMPDPDSGELSSSDYIEKKNDQLKSVLLSSSISLSNVNVEEKENNPAHTKSIFQSYTEEELKLALNDEKKMRMLFGALVTIDDPVGIVMDIGSNIADVLMSDSTYTDLEKTAHTLEILKSNFGINDDPYYNIDEIQEQIKAKELNLALNPYGVIPSDFMQEKWDAEKSEEQLLAEEKERKKIQQTRKNEEWNNKYIQHINSQKFEESLKSLQQKKNEQAAIADALDQFGLEFISKPYLSDHFAFNFEKNNVIDCLTLGECVNYILESCKIGPQMNQYMGKYLYKTEDNNNYFLNFLALNSDQIRQKTNAKINKLLSENLNGVIATQPFGDLINAFNGYLSKIKSEDVKYTLLSNIARGFLNVTGLQPPNNQKINPIAPMMISIFTLSDIEYERVHFKSLSDFNTKMRLYYSSHFNLIGQHNKIGAYIKDSEWKQLYKLFEKQKYIDIPKLEVNKDVLNKLPAGLRTAIIKHGELLKAKNNEVRVSGIAPDAIEEKPTAEFLRFFVMKAGIVGLQYWAYKTTFDNPSLDSAPVEKNARRSAATVGLSMSIVEAFGALLNSSSKVKASLKSLNTFILELTTDNRSIIKGWVWRGFGLFAGLIFGGFDVYNGWSAANNGEKSYGRFLMASGGLVMLGSIMLFFINPFGWLALIAGIVLSLIAYFVKENDIKLWIRKCLLSTDQSIKRFDTIQQQMLGLKSVYH
ncbi:MULTISPECIES: toxin VasX [unclassified Acinetobacter]|uniref:toxin VasX n=1 Tax=unclassified Acinetobacter TaxID=196816 RepID=UPI0015D2DD1B|nr:MULTISPECIES: toxin VasX [unclassified Acinetobacter]UUS64757.1 hypothetical protein MST18_13080 [Acinetobacter sp. YH12068_T]